MPTIFSVLVTIRRRESDAEIPVKLIIEEVLVTSGAMSNLLNHLIEIGLVIKRKAIARQIVSKQCGSDVHHKILLASMLCMTQLQLILQNIND